MKNKMTVGEREILFAEANRTKDNTTDRLIGRVLAGK